MMDLLDFSDLLELLIDFPRFWRLYVGVILSAVISVQIAGDFGSAQLKIGTLFIGFTAGLVLSIIWQNAASRNQDY